MMPYFEKIKNHKRYAPVGVCIYCGSSGGVHGLRDEHIVPYSFWGNLLLPESSCSNCEKITSYIEGVCGRKIFGNLRAKFNSPSRRKKERKTDLDIEVFIGNFVMQKRKVPLCDHPAPIAVPIFPRPGIIAGRQPTEHFPETTFMLHQTIGAMENLAKSLGPNITEIRAPLVFQMKEFARMLAKIGHAFAVANVGLDGFVPFLPKLILGEDPTLSHFVGCDAAPIQPRRIEPFEIGVGRTYETGQLLIAKIRLFSHLGLPVYEVVVGERKPDVPSLVPNQAHLRDDPRDLIVIDDVKRDEMGLGIIDITKPPVVGGGDIDWKCGKCGLMLFKGCNPTDMFIAAIKCAGCGALNLELSHRYRASTGES